MFDLNVQLFCFKCFVLTNIQGIISLNIGEFSVVMTVLKCSTICFIMTEWMNVNLENLITFVLNVET